MKNSKKIPASKEEIPNEVRNFLAQHLVLIHKLYTICGKVVQVRIKKISSIVI